MQDVSSPGVDPGAGLGAGLGAEVRRTDEPQGAMLYDASRTGNFSAQWFDAHYWYAHGQVDGEARGRGNTLFVRHEGRGLALRHYRRGGLAGKLLVDQYLYLGGERTRPMREWQLMYSMHRAGLPVPAPIAARYRRSGLAYTGDLLTERIDGARTLGARVAEGPLPISDWVAVGRCVRRFHDAGVYHADLNAHNVLFDREGAVYLLDFDRGALRQAGLWMDANLVRLRRSLLKITDPLQPGHFSEMDWHCLLAAYADVPRETKS